MNLTAVNRIAKSLLYEGYMLYPYRASAVKNQQRFNFGVLYPRAYAEKEESEAWCSQTECLVLGKQPAFEVRVKFLHLVERTIYAFAPPASNGAEERRVVERLEVDGEVFQPWQEAVEGEICLPVLSVESLMNDKVQIPTDLPLSRSDELIQNSRGETVGAISRKRWPLSMRVGVSARQEISGAFRLLVRVSNLTQISGSVTSREQALLHSAVSTHTVLGVTDGEFVSLLDPPEQLRPSVESCHNIGSFPVLVGVIGERDTMLASPIILYDYPEIAAESAGDLFDATEIDEILSLRILTLTEEEKREVRGSDERARRILERTEALPEEQIMKLHGALRGLQPTQRGSTR